MLDVKRNLTTMTDFYELTMSAGYLDEGYVDKIAVFDMFFRRVPDGGGYAIMAGLQQFIDAVDHLKFTAEDISCRRIISLPARSAQVRAPLSILSYALADSPILSKQSESICFAFSSIGHIS